jgi:hypothetical protein
MDEIKKNDESKLSRRSFFSTAGAFMTGAVATAAVGCTCSPMFKKKEPAKVQAPVTWPYPYVKLDPEEVRKRAYAGYYKGK